MTQYKHEVDAIFATIGLYDQGHATLNLAMLEQAFHPKASIVGYHNDELMFAQRAEYLDILKEDPEPPSDEVASDLKVRDIKIVGDTAVATVQSTMVGTKFTSHLSMLRTSNGWQIVNGLFHANNPAEERKMP